MNNPRPISIFMHDHLMARICHSNQTRFNVVQFDEIRNKFAEILARRNLSTLRELNEINTVIDILIDEVITNRELSTDLTLVRQKGSSLVMTIDISLGLYLFSKLEHLIDILDMENRKTPSLWITGNTLINHLFRQYGPNYITSTGSRLQYCVQQTKEDHFAKWAPLRDNFVTEIKRCIREIMNNPNVPRRTDSFYRESRSQNYETSAMRLQIDYCKTFEIEQFITRLRDVRYNMYRARLTLHPLVYTNTILNWEEFNRCLRSNYSSLRRFDSLTWPHDEILFPPIYHTGIFGRECHSDFRYHETKRWVDRFISPQAWPIPNLPYNIAHGTCLDLNAMMNEYNDMSELAKAILALEQIKVWFDCLQDPPDFLCLPEGYELNYYANSPLTGMADESISQNFYITHFPIIKSIESIVPPPARPWVNREDAAEPYIAASEHPQVDSDDVFVSERTRAMAVVNDVIDAVTPKPDRIKSVKEIKDLETCSICLEIYSEEVYPMLLPCSHMLCKTCLPKIKTQGIYKCGVCRAQNTMAIKNRSVIEQNNVIIKQQERNKQLQNQLKITMKQPTVALRSLSNGDVSKLIAPPTIPLDLIKSELDALKESLDELKNKKTVYSISIPLDKINQSTTTKSGDTINVNTANNNHAINLTPEDFQSMIDRWRLFGETNPPGLPVLPEPLNPNNINIIPLSTASVENNINDMNRLRSEITLEEAQALDEEDPGLEEELSDFLVNQRVRPHTQFSVLARQRDQEAIVRLCGLAKTGRFTNIRRLGTDHIIVEHVFDGNRINDKWFCKFEDNSLNY